MPNGNYHRPACLVITMPDPDNMPVSSNDAEQGGILQWRTDTHNYPQFKIQFPDGNPLNHLKNQTYEGSDEEPVVLRLNNVGEFKYTVQQTKGDGTCKDSGPFLCYVYPCKGCP
jgi:hypothetical protein